MKRLYGIYIAEKNGTKERLVFMPHDAKRTKFGRKFFFGGTGIVALVFTTPNTAHAFAKKEKLVDDFESAQYYVRPINLTNKE